MIPQSKKDTVYNEIKRRILSGEYADGHKLPKELDFAKSLGVSFITLRSALKLLADDDLIARIPSKGTFVKAPSERSEQTELPTVAKKKLLLFIESYRGHVKKVSTFIRQLIGGIAEECLVEDYDLLIFHDSEYERVVNDRSMQNSDLAGIVFDRPPESIYPQIIKVAQERNIPQIMINRKVGNVPDITCNYAGALKHQLRYLHNIGHHHVALVDMPRNESVFIQRRKSFCELLQGYGFKNAEDYLIIPDNPNIPTWVDISQQMKRIPKVTAAISSISVFPALYEYTMDEEIAIPDDLSIIIWGESDQYCLTKQHPYNIFTEGRQVIGKRAIEYIAEYHNNHIPIPGSTLVNGELFIRNSCIFPNNVNQRKEVI